VTKDGHVFCCVADADSTGVLGEADIQRPMQGVLRGPVPADGTGEVFCIGADAGQEEACFPGADPNGANLSGVEQASRLLFSPRAGSRDGRPTSQTPLKLAPFGAEHAEGVARAPQSEAVRCGFSMRLPNS